MVVPQEEEVVMEVAPAVAEAMEVVLEVNLI